MERRKCPWCFGHLYSSESDKPWICPYCKNDVPPGQNLPLDIPLEPEQRKCRVCGCTWDHGCPGGCYWVADDLCSQCD